MGKNVSILMGSPFREQHQFFVERYLKTGEAKVLGTSRIVEGKNKQGEALSLRLCLSRIELGAKDKPNGEFLFSAMFEQIKEKMVEFRVDKAGIILDVQGNPQDVFGYSRKEMVGKNINLIIPSPLAEKHDSFIQEYVKRRTSTVLGKVRNFKCKDKNGDVFPVSLRAEEVPKQSKSGDDLEFIASIWKVDEEVEAFVTANMKGIIISCNDTFKHVFGYESHELIGKNLKILMSSPHSELHDLYIEKYLTTGKGKIVGKGPRQVYARHKDKSSFLVSLEVETFTNEQGEPMFRGKISRITRPKTSTDTDDLPEGYILGCYSLGKVLGKGFFGKVRMCTHLPTGEKVALKTLRKAQYQQVGMSYPPREINLLKNVQHRYVAGLFDIIVLDEKIHLIEEFVTGGELFDHLIKKSHFSEVEARHFFRQILEALGYIHSRGIVHRDLKLENCLLDNCGNVKIIDFGLGNFFNAPGLLKTFCGSADYAAPELWKAQEYVGPEVDVWSLGIILYLMLTGFLPFGDPHCIVAGSFAVPKSVSPGAADLIKKILVPAADRITLEDVRMHPWTNESYSIPIPTFNPQTQVVIDEEVLQEMPKYGFDMESCRKSILQCDHNQYVATYYLLSQKKFREAQKKRRKLDGNFI